MPHQALKLISRPVADVTPDNFIIETLANPPLQENQVLVKVHYLSIDPAMRGWMNDARSYIRPVQLGEVMRALGVGEVIESASEHFKIGDFVSTTTGVQEVALLNAKECIKIDPTRIPLPTFLGTLGMSGLTAYFGMLDTGQPKAGETIVVSGAAGSVGSVAGQIAKIKGCRVVGIAGGQEKCDYVVNTLGFDACVDYKDGNLRKNLKEACPQGIDVYFDNVGGDILDTVLTLINLRARIVICGAISQYNGVPKGPNNYLSLLVNRAKMEGIVVFDNALKYGEGIAQMAQWVMEGKLNTQSHIVEGGVVQFTSALLGLFKGDNMGKTILKVS